MKLHLESHQFSSISLTIVLLIAFAGSELLNAQPSLIHLSLQSTSSPEATAPVTVTWCSDNKGGNQFVRYGLTPDRNKKVKAVKNEFNGKALYHADLKKLKPGAEYFYKCGSDEAGWSTIYSFNSEPRKGTFRVGVIGDTQNNNQNEEFQKTWNILNLVQTYSPHFTLHMGDIVNDGSQKESWINFLSVSQELNAISPLMPVLGNHDIQNNKGDDFQKPFQDYHSLFNLPGDEVNYSFNYGSVRFIGIFSGCAQAAQEIDQVKYKPGSPEYVWLDNELTNAEKDGNSKWIIVWMHYPVSSFGWSNIAGWKENLMPLLERHRIDLCLSGHRHVYERHYQMNDGLPVKNESGSEFSSADGPIFITNGTAGGNPTGPGGKDIPDIAFTPDKMIYSFAVMDICNKSLIYRVFDQNNILIDKFLLSR
jgi:acid phosphatase type 7